MRSVEAENGPLAFVWVTAPVEDSSKGASAAIVSLSDSDPDRSSMLSVVDFEVSILTSMMSAVSKPLADADTLWATGLRPGML